MSGPAGGSRRPSPEKSHKVAPGRVVQGREMGVSQGSPGPALHRTGEPGTPFLRPQRGFTAIQDPSPRVEGLALGVPICLRYSSVVTASGLGPAQPAGQKVSNQLLPVLPGRWGMEGPRPSGHHTEAPGDPPPEVATAAAEGHLGRLLEDGVDVLLEQSRALEVGHGAHGPRHLLALGGSATGLLSAGHRWGPPVQPHPPPTRPLGRPRRAPLGYPQLRPPGLTKHPDGFIVYCLSSWLGLCLSRYQLINFPA